MCQYSNRCGREVCYGMRHHWLEIKAKHPPLYGKEREELLGYRAELAREAAKIEKQIIAERGKADG